MKRLIILFIALNIIAGCSAKIPNCSDPETLRQLKTKLSEEVSKNTKEILTNISQPAHEDDISVYMNGKYEYSINLINAISPDLIAKNITMTIENIRASAFDENIKKYTCEADAVSVLPPIEDHYLYNQQKNIKNPIKYAIQLTDEKKPFVNISSYDSELAKSVNEHAVIVEFNKVENQITQAASLCNADEKIIFSCRLNGKSTSICASNNLSENDGYMQFRLGTREKMEIIFPEPKLHPSKFATGKNFSFMGASGGSYLRMKNGEFDLIAYTGEGNDWRKIGVRQDKAGVPVGIMMCDPSIYDVDNIRIEVYLKGIIPEDTGEFYLPD